MMDLTRLRLLRELAHRGTMTAVATAFGLTSSAVSQQLAVLEREARVVLLERVGRRVLLTAEGSGWQHMPRPSSRPSRPPSWI